MHELDCKASHVSVFCESINILSMWTLEISLSGVFFFVFFDLTQLLVQYIIGIRW